MKHLSAAIVVLGLVSGSVHAEGDRPQPTDRSISDGFEGKLALDWQILHPDPTHYSLSKKQGSLTITTQEGGFAEAATSYKNLFLIDVPAAGNFTITTCISSFTPVADWNQAGLICYNDDDNNLKFVFEHAGSPCLTALAETNGERFSAYFPPARPPKKIILRLLSDPLGVRKEQPKPTWLRIMKDGNHYSFLVSLDGKAFRMCTSPVVSSEGFTTGTIHWGDGSVKKVGLFAKNGPLSSAPELDASFDSFHFEHIPAPAREASKFVIPEENREIPVEMQSCAANFLEIRAAIDKYRTDKGELPEWLSDLVPDYIDKETLLCPNDSEQKDRFWPDPKLPCSFTYEFSLSRVPEEWGPMGNKPCREWKMLQMKLFGNLVPIVRCQHHGENALNLSFGGDLYCRAGLWETLFMPDYQWGQEFSLKEE